MIFQRILWVITGLLLVAALYMGVQAIMDFSVATVVVEWTTASELNTVGFNLYRSESPQGPFTRINPNLIPPSDDPLTGGDYAYTDTDVVAGKTYYYELEDVENSGSATRHGPITVEARSSGPTQLGLSIFLAVAALFGGYMLRSSRAKQPENKPVDEVNPSHAGG